MASYQLTEQDLLEQGCQQLEELLGRGWSVSSSRAMSDRRIDAVWELQRGNGEEPARVFVEVKSRLSPIQAEQVLQQIRRFAPDQTWLVVAPWLSPRTRHLLSENNVNYLDFTGNTQLRTEQPTIVIRTDGSDQSPMVDDRPRRSITGPKAALLVRELTDFSEPRRANELAVATNLSESYVSRLLDSLSDEALIKRDNKTKVITSIDWQGLLRARASTTRLLKTNRPIPAIFRVGRSQVLQHLSAFAERLGDDLPVLATGSYALEGLGIRSTVDGALMLYVQRGQDAVRDASKALGLLRVDQAQAADADVLFLQPQLDASATIFRRSRRLDSGLPVVAMSQLALDCLSGPGRLPADGEALIEWMANNEEEWRGRSPLLSAVD
jgi:hypothetical protein